MLFVFLIIVNLLFSTFANKMIISDEYTTKEQVINGIIESNCPTCHKKINSNLFDEKKITRTKSQTKIQIPLSIIMELNQMSNELDIFRKLLPHENMKSLPRNREFISNSLTIVPKAAGCSVEYKTINLKDTDDPSLYYSPPCTRVGRCGGCCSHDLLACQPVNTDIIDFEITVMQYNSDGSFQFKEKKTVTVEQHTKCKCGCLIKEKDCNSLQKYLANECRCECINEDEQNKCNEESDLKMWNSDTCICQCREEKECSTGFTFDYSTCMCESDNS
ncbi:uncharacterized protein LOC126907542 isoform X2 [Daktulosphaira vitifoliae]|uniref:uncharacterized protein LOC126907542 isoform X2 n=1 Tax=Daktulosphaira vitifoliae TaxID=58002 RepID=UPI0021A986A9|nr:uncharacterized protein LOC126907542 isoform X2 [Daktulosphaira vitifoliae]